MAKISIIIPVYNKAPWLKRCFDSLVNQTEKDFEVIIIDDGSTDNSGDICKKYAKENGWSLYLQANAGVSAARNWGIDKAIGDYIAFLDADDSYTEDAIKVMKNMAKDFKYNIIQFGQYRAGTRPHTQAPRGDYELPNCTVEFWEFTTNKLYRLSFLRENKIRFIEGLQFGEDEMFNVETFIANHGFRQASVALYNHYLDDSNSLCRGGLDLAKLTVLDKLLRERIVKLVQDGGDQWVDGAEWLIKQCRTHYNSKTFKRFGFEQKPRGDYDIVYFVKNTPHNEELKYSLRSVEQNWFYKDIWFYGGCPKDLEPDYYVKAVQNAPTKWENVRNMMLEVCQNDEITENFWLFNDDFFILRPIKEFEPRYDGTLTTKIQEIRDKHHGEDSEWSKNLGKLQKLLKKHSKSEFCYAIHEPMLINRKKMLEVLKMFPNEPMQRALYGNWWSIGGVQEKDPKYTLPEMSDIADKIVKHDIISTSDESFRVGYVGKWIRDKFPNKSRFEV
jgi:glycosyltransferase involved in cell wall biosynthesis